MRKMNGNYEDYLLRELNADAGENDNDCDPKPEPVLPESFEEWLKQTGDSICE